MTSHVTVRWYVDDQEVPDTSQSGRLNVVGDNFPVLKPMGRLKHPRADGSFVLSKLTSEPHLEDCTVTISHGNFHGRITFETREEAMAFLQTALKKVAKQTPPAVPAAVVPVPKKTGTQKRRHIDEAFTEMSLHGRSELLGVQHKVEEVSSKRRAIDSRTTSSPEQTSKRIARIPIRAPAPSSSILQRRPSKTPQDSSLYGGYRPAISFGLQNLGNTCYLNAITQALGSLREFVEDLRAMPKHLPDVSNGALFRCTAGNACGRIGFGSAWSDLQRQAPASIYTGRVACAKTTRIKSTYSEKLVEPAIDQPLARQEVAHSAASAALEALQAGANATTVLMPSGAGDLDVGLEIVRGFIDTLDSGSPLRIMVTVPSSLAWLARGMYESSFGESLTLIDLDDRGVSRDRIARTLQKKSSMIFLCPYDMILKFGLAFIESKIKMPLDLVVFATAHILRAGGFHSLGARDDVIPAARRVFISARHLVGMAPGALLAPGQEPGYPKEAPQSRFGQEVFRLNHEDAEKRELTVPIRLQIIQSVTVREVAEELAELHEKLGIRSIHIVPKQPRLAVALDESLGKLTGDCRVTSGESSEASFDALLVAGTRPGYVALAQEFPRLANWQPGKTAGLLIVAGAAKHHASAAWMAFAIEDARAEEALQRTSVEYGRIDRRLKWNQLPLELRRVVNTGNARDEAEVAIARGVEILGDPWDMWLGRLLAYKDRHSSANARFLATQFGHELGSWLQDQRQAWEQGILHERKVARLKALGVMLDKEAETFAKGLSELRTYVAQQRSSTVPASWVTDSGFMLGDWVVAQRTAQRRGKLSLQKQLLLKEAFFLWQPSEAPSWMFEHPSDPEAAELTHSIEEELRSVRWQTITERRGIFRAMVLKHHPDISDSKYANDAIRFLSEAKDWPMFQGNVQQDAHEFFLEYMNQLHDEMLKLHQGWVAKNSHAAIEEPALATQTHFDAEVQRQLSCVQP
ncbi:unnamed protein product [Durusdinium trenchii]|uniref:Ubiquitinyl hydrolase 1 n=1 Tax=Durusdinium trenchii TaxID=1381693 RepID=A0ABP0MAE1_9DINO